MISINCLRNGYLTSQEILPHRILKLVKIIIHKSWWFIRINHALLSHIKWLHITIAVKWRPSLDIITSLSTTSVLIFIYHFVHLFIVILTFLLNQRNLILIWFRFILQIFKVIWILTLRESIRANLVFTNKLFLHFYIIFMLNLLIDFTTW